MRRHQNGYTTSESGIEPEYLHPEHELPQSLNQQQAQSSSIEVVASLYGEPSEIEKLKAEREALLDRLARVQAEFENVRRRMERAQQEARALAVGETLKTLYPLSTALSWRCGPQPRIPRSFAEALI